MPWNPQFIEDLQAGVLHPRYLLESQLVGSFSPITAPLMLSSFAADGFQNCLTRDGSSITHGSLNPGTWSRSYGTLTLGITPGIDLRKTVARGMVCRFLVGFSGYDLGDFECVWLGAIRNLTYQSGRWSLYLTELAGALQNRFSDESDEQNLFFNLPFKTKVDGGYDPSVDTDLDVLATGTPVAFEASDTGDYAARISPSEGNPYYIAATSLASLTLSGVTAGKFDSPLNNHNPPAVGTPDTADDGDRVEAIAWIDAHPLAMVRQVLTSTGSVGYNGVDDKLPRSWGYEFPFGLIDRDDISAYIDLTIPDHWDVLVDHGQADGQGWLTETLRPAGMFLATRQGCLTARAVVSYTGKKTPGSLTINDDDISDIVEYQTWDDQSQVEYQHERVFCYNEAAVASFAELNVATRPTRARQRRDLLFAFDSEGNTAWSEEVANRLGPYDTRVPERFTIELAGWRTAIATMGDIVFLTTAFLVPRTSLRGGHDPLEGTPCLVVGGGIDWFSATSRLELLHVPQYEGVE